MQTIATTWTEAGNIPARRQQLNYPDEGVVETTPATLSATDETNGRPEATPGDTWEVGCVSRCQIDPDLTRRAPGSSPLFAVIFPLERIPPPPRWRGAIKEQPR